MNVRWWIVPGLLAAIIPAGAADLSLPPAEQPRRVVTDRTWPAAPAQPEICLWSDDKLAAVSITIDDNHVEDHPWWLAQGRASGWTWTWFVIAGRVGTPGPWGTWDDWRAIHAAGHEVQSHSLFHLDPRRAPPLPIEREYADARALIEEQVPGARCLTLAYPNGYGPPNDAAVAARTYVAARGVKGFPNPPATVNYREVNSVSAGAGFEEPATHWASLASLLNPASPRTFRAWYCCHFHGLTEELKARVESMVRLLKQHEADVWVGSFRAVALYGQERDTARLTVVSADATGLRFQLEDDLPDAEFDQPLTLKVRLPDGWSGAQAWQDARPVPVTVVARDGVSYALVAATPDRGLVEVKP